MAIRQANADKQQVCVDSWWFIIDRLLAGFLPNYAIILCYNLNLIDGLKTIRFIRWSPCDYGVLEKEKNLFKRCSE